MRDIKVSVLMITYKHDKFIEQAVNSVLEQKTNFDFELIIANDNSPDKTHKIINKIIKNHPKAYWIKYIENDVNLGPNANYIKAYNSSKGKYIAICEGDDYWGDEFKLQQQVDFLDHNPDYVLTYHDAECVDKDGLKLMNIPAKRTQKELSQLELMQGNQPIFLTTCYRRFPGVIPFEMKNLINGDTFLTSILGNYGKGRWLDIRPAFYRYHGGGVWSLKDKEYKLKAQIQLYAVLKKHYELQKSQNLVDFFKKQTFEHYNMLLSHYIKKRNFIGLLKYAFNKYSR